MFPGDMLPIVAALIWTTGGSITASKPSSSRERIVGELSHTLRRQRNWLKRPSL